MQKAHHRLTLAEEALGKENLCSIQIKDLAGRSRTKQSTADGGRKSKSSMNWRVDP